VTIFYIELTHEINPCGRFCSTTRKLRVERSRDGHCGGVYAGKFNPQTKKFAKGEFVVAEKTGVSAQNIAPGSWIKLKNNLSTMIADYAKTGMARATDSPLTKNATITATCRKLPAGQRLYVMDKQIADASGVRNIWLRVRLSPPGVAPGGS
jgi:hypothetical protein